MLNLTKDKVERLTLSLVHCTFDIDWVRLLRVFPKERVRYKGQGIITVIGECYQTGSDALLLSAFDRTTKGFGFAAFNIFASQQSIKRVTQIVGFGLRGITIVIHAAVID